MILLDANENPFNSTVNRYPDPMQNKLKSRIAEAKELIAIKSFRQWERRSPKPAYACIL